MVFDPIFCYKIISNHQTGWRIRPHVMMRSICDLLLTAVAALTCPTFKTLENSGTAGWDFFAFFAAYRLVSMTFTLLLKPNKKLPLELITLNVWTFCVDRIIIMTKTTRIVWRRTRIVLAVMFWPLSLLIAIQNSWQLRSRDDTCLLVVFGTGDLTSIELLSLATLSKSLRLKTLKTFFTE